MRWFDRTFPFDLSPQVFPNIVERLRGTPARLEELIRNTSSGDLTRRWEDTWSIQENAGHLFDLESLWMDRVRDLQASKPVLTETDLTNRLTWERNHNVSPIEDILRSFRSAREALLRELDAAGAWIIERAAKHPRLGKPMRLIDHAFFIAEHDDHHLARITQLKQLLVKSDLLTNLREEKSVLDVVLKRFETPDEVRQMPKGRFEIVRIGGMAVGRATYEPGWRWSEDVGPTVGTSRCSVEHIGLVLSGTATAAFQDGHVVELRAGELFHIPARPHDSWVVGDQPYISLHFMGTDHYAK